jgi:hypothetical protein
MLRGRRAHRSTGAPCASCHCPARVRFELEFQLFDLLVELLGAAAELHVPQLGQHQLQMFDLGGARR